MTGIRSDRFVIAFKMSSFARENRESSLNKEKLR